MNIMLKTIVLQPSAILFFRTFYNLEKCPLSKMSKLKNGRYGTIQTVLWESVIILAVEDVDG